MSIWFETFIEERALERCRIKNPHAPGAVRALLEQVYRDALAERHTDGIFRLPHSYQQLLGYRDEWERYRYADAARHRLRKFLHEKHLEEKRIGEKLTQRLSDDDVAEAIRVRLLTKQELLPAGLVCAISYDIPECQRDVRDKLRYFLKQIGCRIVHQSLWKTNRDLIRELRELFSVKGAEKWIKIFNIPSS